MGGIRRAEVGVLAAKRRKKLGVWRGWVGRLWARGDGDVTERSTGDPGGFCVGGRMEGRRDYWQDGDMSSTLLTFLTLASLLFAAAAIITVRAVRNAPEGHEDDEGFQLSRVQVDGESPGGLVGGGVGIGLLGAVSGGVAV